MLTDMIAIWQKYSYVFTEGIKWTLILTVITVFFGTVLGIVIAFMKMSKSKILNGITVIYIEIIRGAPMLLQLYFFWLWLPKAMPFEMSERACIIVALIVNSSAYIAEIIRAGIQAVDSGQTEAAKSLGIRNSYMMRYIILPQAIKNILPAIGNQFILMLKNTSLASTFFIGELMTSWRTVQTATYKPIPALMIVGIIYVLMTWTLTMLLDKFERRLAESD
ncbi:MAG: amino acid ABC transporter permease [Oscillospiraceae bacterium]|nr:amino acid ABC transporter permease [Oscillospiraceae bacterium]